MTTTCHSRGRAAYTLIELLTVMSIIAALAAITALFFPSFQDREMVSRGADQTVQWLLMAKQQAKRDGLPTGIRFIVNNNICTEMQYIQQPDDFAQGQYISGTGTTATFQLPAGVTFGSAALPVQVGDYLELYGGGTTRLITAIASGNTLTVAASVNALPNPTTTPATTAPTNYRIIPAPRPLAGERSMNLPTGVIIDFNGNHPLVTVPGDTSKALTRNVPMRGGFQEILFAPSGAVIGQGTSTAQIVLWVRNGDPDNSADLLMGKPILVSVRPRTGFLASFQAATGNGDPFAFCRDGKGTGL